MDVELLLMLVAGHYVADFALQPEYMATNKRLIFKESIGFHTLTAHAFVHAFVAGLLSGSFMAAVIIGTSHWLIDFGKASEFIDDRFPHTKGARRRGQKYGLYGINVDQLLHLSVILFVGFFVI